MKETCNSNSSSEIEKFSRIFSLKLAEKNEKKLISIQDSVKILVKFVSALDLNEAKTMEKIINSI